MIRVTQLGEDEPIYVISVAARLVEMHPQTLRYYERAGLLKPTRSTGKIRLYSQKEIERLRKIARLTSELGVNLAGVEIIINLTQQLEKMQVREAELLAQVTRLHDEINSGQHETIKTSRVIKHSTKP